MERPLSSITAAIAIAEPGDTILIRGGTYVCLQPVHIDTSGLPDKPICLKAYPGEVPVLDFSRFKRDLVAKEDSVFIAGAYWHIKGIVINGANMAGLRLDGKGAHHNVLEQVVVRGSGIKVIGQAAYNLVINCDASHGLDYLRNGQNSDGFVLRSVGAGNVLIGDRAWNNSDDGFDTWYAGNPVRLESCYAWRNGENIWNHPFFDGNGNGFKLGGGEGRHVLIGCLAWGHSLTGASLNGNTSGVTLRNCTVWDNFKNYSFDVKTWLEEARKNSVFINNISYAGRLRVRGLGSGEAIHRKARSQNNSWDSGLSLTLTDGDFLSLDDSMMSAPRNPDGSIPQNNFLRLAPGSAAIDKGVDVGMPFVGPKPDLGAFEYDPNETSEGYVKMLHQAVRDHDVKQIEQLLAQGEGIDEKDWLGYTPLHWAVYFGYPDLIELLISKGADPNIQSDTGRYALEIARAMAYSELEALLHKLGAKAGDVSTNEGSQETESAEKQEAIGKKPSS